MKIQSHIKMAVCTAVLCVTVFGLLGVSGCIKPDKETLARIDALETRLDHVEQLLVQAQNQREAFIQKLESMSEAMTAAQTQVQQLTEFKHVAVDTKLSEITAQRDAAIAENKEMHAQIQQLNGQLTQQAKEIADFKLLVTDVKAQIADLEKAISPLPEESPAPTDTEQPKTQKAMVGFPETDPSVTVIRGPSRK